MSSCAVPYGLNQRFWNEGTVKPLSQQQLLFEKQGQFFKAGTPACSFFSKDVQYHCNRSTGLLFSDVLLQYIIRTESGRNMNFRHGPIFCALFEDNLKKINVSFRSWQELQKLSETSKIVKYKRLHRNPGYIEWGLDFLHSKFREHLTLPRGEKNTPSKFFNQSFKAILIH